MKKVIRITALVLMVLFILPILSFKPEVRNSLTLVNNTGSSIYASIAWFKKQERCWVSGGWYYIAPYQKYRTDLADLDLGSHSMYVYAEDKENHIAWRGNTEYKVDDKQMDFKIYYADKTQGSTSTRKYTLVTVDKGDREYIFNK